MKLLFIDGCVSQRGPASRTRALAEAFLSAFRESHPGAEVETVTLEALDLKPFLPAALNQRDELASVGAFGAPVFDLARQFQAADKIIAAAPFWDLSFPAILKIYIENVCVEGITFACDEEGLHGSCKASRMVFLTTRGAVYGGSPLEQGSRYLEAMARFFGIPAYSCIAAVGMDLGDPASPLAGACEQAEALARSL